MTMADVLALPQTTPVGWGATLDYDARPATYKDGTTVHYTGDRDTARNLLNAGHPACRHLLQSVEGFHRRKGWAGIGYNWAICPHGTLLRLRGRARGAHNPEDSDGDGLSDNVDAAGVLVMLGQDEKMHAPQEQMLRRFCDAHAMPVYPHSEARFTRCPDDHLRGWINAYRAGDQPARSTAAAGDTMFCTYGDGPRDERVMALQVRLRVVSPAVRDVLTFDGDDLLVIQTTTSSVILARLTG